MNEAANEMAPTEQEVFDKYYAEEQRKGAVDAITAQIKLTEEQIAMGDAFLRLEKDKDFILCIEKGYIQDVRDRIVKTLGRSLEEKVRNDLHMLLDGVGSFQTHLEGIMQLHGNAKTTLPQLKDELSGLSGSVEDDE